MAYNLSERTISLPVAADLSNNQFCFVKQDTTGQAVPCSTGSYALGILSNIPSAGTFPSGSQIQATVVVDGVTRLCVNDAYNAGTFLRPVSNADGTGWGSIVAHSADGTSNACYIRARTLQASSAAGDVVAVELMGPQPGVNSTSNP